MQSWVSRAVLIGPWLFEITFATDRNAHLYAYSWPKRGNLRYFWIVSRVDLNFGVRVTLVRGGGGGGGWSGGGGKVRQTEVSETEREDLNFTRGDV